MANNKKSYLEGRIKQLEEMVHERDARIIELANKLSGESKNRLYLNQEHCATGDEDSWGTKSKKKEKN